MLQHRQHLQELRRQEANSKCQAYLIDGADMTAMSKSRPMHRGWLGPTTKICLRKKELSSTSWTTQEHPSFPTLEQTSILQTTKTCSWTLRRCKSTGKKRQLLLVTHNVSPLGLASLWFNFIDQLACGARRCSIHPLHRVPRARYCCPTRAGPVPFLKIASQASARGRDWPVQKSHHKPAPASARSPCCQCGGPRVVS